MDENAELFERAVTAFRGRLTGVLSQMREADDPVGLCETLQGF